jgi:hypothetical protein
VECFLDPEIGRSLSSRFFPRDDPTFYNSSFKCCGFLDQREISFGASHQRSRHIVAMAEHNGNGVVVPNLTSPAETSTAPTSTNGSAHNTILSGKGAANGTTSLLSTSFAVKAGLAQQLKGGVIMDVTSASQARIAEQAGACAVMALERVPADIRKDGGVARMSDPAVIQEIQAAVSIPVMAKARIGHFVEAQVLQALEVDYIDESEVLTPADQAFHIEKSGFGVPFVCGCRNLGEALR